MIKYLYNKLLLLVPDSIYIPYRMKKYYNKFSDINNPKTLNEKIHWLKLHDRSNLHVICADKLKVRKYISKKIGKKYLNDLIFYTTNYKDIKKDNLPDFPVVIKTNHDSGGVVIVKDKNTENFKVIRKHIKKKLKINYYNKDREWQYKNIKKYIIVEKMIGNQVDIPHDYKVHCFNGKPCFIQVDLDRMSTHKRNLYDTKWNFIDVRWRHPNGVIEKKPQRLNEMLMLAEILSEEFLYARVDFYLTRKQVYFGEITFHPGGGYEKFFPSQFDEKFGKMLDLNK